MKNACIFHGTDCSPQSYWLPYITKELIKNGFDVWVPQLPQADKPDISLWLPFALKHGTYTKDTVLIGHSAGCPLILSILESTKARVKKAILVAGFITPLDANPEPILQKRYDWKKIRDNVSDIIYINSDNDPWGCNDKQGRAMFDKLGGTLIIRHGEGHMGSDTFKQPYREFPLLLKLID